MVKFLNMLIFRLGGLLTLFPVPNWVALSPYWLRRCRLELILHFADVGLDGFADGWKVFLVEQL